MFMFPNILPIWYKSIPVLNVIFISTNLSNFLKLCLPYCQKLLEVASVALRNTHAENKRAKTKRSFAHLYFLNYCYR